LPCAPSFQSRHQSASAPSLPLMATEARFNSRSIYRRL
jgi:hypothetical protein